MWTTKVAQFASKCRRCGGQIAVGQRFRYGRMPGWKHGIGYHLKADCPVKQEPSGGSVEPAPIHQPSPLESSVDAAAEWSIDAAIAEAHARRS